MSGQNYLFLFVLNKNSAAKIILLRLILNKKTYKILLIKYLLSSL